MAIGEIAACRHGAWLASQAMKCVTSFLNRLLAMAMEDQEIIFKYDCYPAETRCWNLAVRYPSLFCAASRADDLLACMQPAAG